MTLPSTDHRMIVDLSQTTRRTRNSSFVDIWSKPSEEILSADFHPDEHQIVSIDENFQWKNPTENPSEIFYSKLDDILREKTSKTKKRRKSTLIIHELKPSIHIEEKPFIWSKYLSIVDERSISEEFFDHFLASIQSDLETEMIIEYVYDLQQEFVCFAQIQLVSHQFVRLHLLGLPENVQHDDFWTSIYDSRCHSIGWAEENQKTFVSKQIDPKDFTSPPSHVFDQSIGLNPIEQIRIGMIFELQNEKRPWTLWFVKIIENRGGRLRLRYVFSSNDNDDDEKHDIYIFYLHWRFHRVGWSSIRSDIYSYELPNGSSSSLTIDRTQLIEFCLSKSQNQFHSTTLFNEQEEIRPHRFVEGMKLEVFDEKTQHVYLATIGQIHNEFYFDVQIDNDEQRTFVGYATHPFLLPAHWAAEHRLALMKNKDLRQNEDFWNIFTEKNGLSLIATERCFNLIKLNSNGNHRVEPGMKFEWISNFNGQDRMFSVTLVHIADHLMWLRIDDPTSIEDENFSYRVVPINSLDIFPVGWAKFNGFHLTKPFEYQIEMKTFEENRSTLFSSVTRFPRIPRVYHDEIYQLTIFVNIRCFSGPNLCSSRLARIPSQFGPGPYRHVLIDMFHFLLSAASTTAHRALRRLEHSNNSNHLKIELIKVAKRAAKIIRPVALPTDPKWVHQYLRHVCSQLESCPNLISLKRFEKTSCPDKCFLLSNTFALSMHSKHKRTGTAQLRAAQQRQRKQKSLLCQLKTDVPSSTVSTPIVEELPLIESSSSSSEPVQNSDLPLPQPGSDRITRGFRVHIEPRTHTVTRTNRKQKLSANLSIKKEPIDEIPHPSSLPSTPAPLPISTATVQKESTQQQQQQYQKPVRSRSMKKTSSPTPSVTSNVSYATTTMATQDPPASPSNKKKKKRRLSPSIGDYPSPSDESASMTDLQSLIPTSLPIPPSRNPVTWNVNDVCWYLNQTGCSFALKTIQEQEIDGAALLLLDDLPKVQDLLEFKLGPAVKFCHVVEQLRTQVIDTFHSSPSLKPKRLSSS